MTKKSTCNSSRDDNRYTCYSDESLIKMKKYWNARHPDEKIISDKPKEIWKSLTLYTKGLCSNEKCWLRQKFMANKINTELSTYTFAPSAPDKWKKNPNEWLTSVDINKVMKQWERRYKDFIFIGPSPLDFDSPSQYIQDDNVCVWPELCNFELSKLLAKNKSKIGIIFNLDPHYKEGSHWVALYIDVSRGVIFYFDSNGDKTPKEIEKLITKIKSQGKNIILKDGEGIKFDIMENHPKQHQRENTECGIYTIYFITELLSGKKTFEYFKTVTIPDKDMEALRKKYFSLD